MTDYTLMTDESHPEVMQHFRRICKNAGLMKIPEVRVTQLETLKARIELQDGETLDERIKFITINTGFLEILTPEESAAILAHEVGHALQPEDVVKKRYRGLIMIGGYLIVGPTILQKSVELIDGFSENIGSVEKISRRRAIPLLAQRMVELAGIGTVIYGYGGLSMDKRIFAYHSQTDRIGTELTGDIDSLISALQKVNEYHKTHTPNHQSDELDYRLNELKELRKRLTEPQQEKQSPNR